MPAPNFMILYVKDAAASAAFYRALLELEPVQASPAFVLFALPNGLMLGLWSLHTVEPAAGGGGEIAFTEKNMAAVDATHRAWRAKSIKIVQEPGPMDFGYTFVALDPDGHRLRIFCPGKE